MSNSSSSQRILWYSGIVLFIASCGGGIGGSTPAAPPGSSPVVTVESPGNGSVVRRNPATVHGTVDPPNAAVTVNGVAAPVTKGQFSADITLNDGLNSIPITARSPSGSVTSVLDVTLNTTEMCGTGETFTVSLPGLFLPDDPSTLLLPGRTLPDDSVTLPKGCDVYAILIHGYGRNGLFDELMFYKLAKWVAGHNGYVHWSWWNNFTGEYMSKPLHVIPGTSWGNNRYPTPGNINEFENKLDFFARGGKGKAVPDEDFQFQSDAKRVLEQIRANNPGAIVIVAGHSMGGNATVRLGSAAPVPIDLLAPIDPVGNRNIPEGEGSSVAYGTGLKSAVPGTARYDSGNETFNWTRWRATRNFLGWIDRDCVRNALGVCKDFQPLNPFKHDYRCVTVNSTLSETKPPSGGPIAEKYCPDWYRARSFKFSSVRRLYHRWQKETYFPFDWKANYVLPFTAAPLHNEQPFNVDYHNYQRPVEEYALDELPPPRPLATAPKTCRFDSQRDPSGAVSFQNVLLECQDWDGHGEIIGMRATRSRLVGPTPPTRENLNPLAATADFPGGGWSRSSPWHPDINVDDSGCADDACRAAAARRKALIGMANPGTWPYEPQNPNLDLVVNDMVAIADDLWAHRESTPGGGPDVTPPVSSAGVDPAPTTYGWNNTDADVTISAVDEEGGSGVKEIVYTLGGATTGTGVVPGNSADIAVSIEGTTTVEYFARDNAGNEETPKILEVKIDKTPPDIDGSGDPPPNAYGWNNTDVIVTFTGSDGLSGIDTVTAPVVLTDEGANQEVVGTAVDRAGNTASIGVIVNIDKTPPVIGGLPANCVLWPPDHRMVNVATLVVTDALSGVADSSAGAVSSEPESGPSYGTFVPDVLIEDNVVTLRAERYSAKGRRYDLSETATDHAGNTAMDSAVCTVPHDQRP